MTQSDPIARFDGKKLREPVQMRELRPDVFLVSWIDGEMGMLAQIIDLENGTVLATIPSEDEPNTTEIISAAISSFVG